MLKTTMLIAGILLATSSVQAQDKMPGMKHDMPMGHDSGSTAALKAANAKMHEAMAAPMTGNADVDFVRGMIAHHQGAIDMAKVELQYGKDEKIRALAKDIIKAQEGEITMMKAWLKAHGQ